MGNTKISVYKKWAPDDCIWTAWAKPVLFASLNNRELELREIKKVENIDWLSQLDSQTAIIIDLPGENSVLTAISLAKKGYRPVPLYNGCRGLSEKNMLVNVVPITQLLSSGAIEIENAQISEHAAPVFMLDSRRMLGNSTDPGKFDNRWCIFAQDMPSGKFLKDKGFNKVFVFTDYIREDLSHVLFRYQKDGIHILTLGNRNLVEEKQVNRPSSFKTLLYRSSILFGLRRNSTGGFGGRIPEPMEHNAGVGYRGIG